MSVECSPVLCLRAVQDTGGSDPIRSIQASLHIAGWSGEVGGSISRGPAVPYWPAFPYYIFSCLHPLNAFLSSDAEQMKTYNNAADSMTYIFGGEGVTQYLLRGILERLKHRNG